MDFHESWLEEMEIYKDKLFIQKHQQHQLLGSHNHVHTPQGCEVETQLINSLTNNNHKTNTSSTISTNNAFTTSSLNSPEKTSRCRGGESSALHRSRITVRTKSNVSAAANTLPPHDAKLKPSQNTNVQLILKRPRDEASLNKPPASQSKRAPYAHMRHYSSSTQSNALANSSSITANESASAIVSPRVGSNISTTNGKTAKIIVNPFHASSLLSSQQHDEKTKTLTQNGLTKSAATAYETSLYASCYLPHDIKPAKGGEGEKLRDAYGGVTSTEDDPCSAIDDVNEYTDSDTDEEYTGEPFFLKEDDGITQQSLNIRHPQEHTSSDDSEDPQTEYVTPRSILAPSIFPNVPPYLNFSSHVEKGPPMPEALHKVLKWKLSPVMPKIVKRVVLNSGFRIIKNTTDWNAIWEKHMKSPGFRTIRSHQKYNHMPGSFRIGRKDSMWKNIHNNMKKFGSKEFGFMQKSYIMPEDLESLRKVWPKNATKLTKWIVKPPASARGAGIRIVNKWSQFPKDRPLVIQKYIERPLLINDNKFDLRLYVVLTSINPLRIYMYKDGLVRFASVKYSSELTSLDDRCMHLTNYSINKFSENYSKNEDFNACQGHKWTLQSLWSCLENRGVNTNHLWATLRNLVIKSIISGESGLNRMYRQNVNFRYNCFELFGFDVLLDENMIPWLLEINISPSLHSELPLDLHVKGPLIQAVLNTALYQVPPKLNEQQQRQILEEFNMQGPLCHDKRIFTTCLTAEEVRKHNQFTNRTIEVREEYIEAILENLLPDDVRCIMLAEDELARCTPLERVFPTPKTHMYLKFIESPRYYNRLLDAWEHKYGGNKDVGIRMISALCREKYHLEVSDAALEKEPNVALTEIDMLHVKKSDILVDTSQDSKVNIVDNAARSKYTASDSNADSISTLITSSSWQ